MEITREKKGLEVTMKLKGRLDTVTAPELEAEIKTLGEDTERLILDFAALDYISSAGLRVLLAAHKMMNKRMGMKILHANEMVQEVFEATGFSEIFHIED